MSIGFDTNAVVTSAALFRAYNQIKGEMAKFRDALSKGQTAVSDLAGINKFNTEIIFEGKKYNFAVSRISKDRMRCGSLSICCHAHQSFYRCR